MEGKYKSYKPRVDFSMLGNTKIIKKDSECHFLGIHVEGYHAFAWIRAINNGAEMKIPIKVFEDYFYHYSNNIIN